MTLAFQGSICAQILGTKVCRPCQSGWCLPLESVCGARGASGLRWSVPGFGEQRSLRRKRQTLRLQIHGSRQT